MLRRLKISCLFAVLLASLLWLPQIAQAATVGDEFLAVYISSILERELHWPHGSYVLQVDRGVATITLKEDVPERRALATQHLENIVGLQSIHFSSAVTSTDSAAPLAV